MHLQRQWQIDVKQSGCPPGRLVFSLPAEPDNRKAELYVGPHGFMKERFALSLVIADGEVECDSFPLPAQVRAAVIALLQARNLPPLPSDILDQLPKDAA